jgi:maltodextrin utilization protein YvdJ
MLIRKKALEVNLNSGSMKKNNYTNKEIADFIKDDWQAEVDRTIFIKGLLVGSVVSTVSFLIVFYIQS